MATDNNRILHQYRPKFLLRLVPLFCALGCAIVAVSAGLPALLPTSDPGLWLTSTVGVVMGLALPIAAGVIWLRVPTITLRLDAARGVVAVEYQRPLRLTTDEYRVADIAGIGAMTMGTRAYTLMMTLRDGEKIRLEYGTTGNAAEVNQRAAAIRKALGPTTLPI